MPAFAGVAQRGSQQFSEVMRVRPGLAPVRVGNNFAVMLLTGFVAPLLAPGQTITGDTSGATAIVTAVTGPGTIDGDGALGSPKFVVNSVSVTPFIPGEPITASGGGVGVFDSTQAREFSGLVQLAKQDAVITFNDKLITVLLHWLWQFNPISLNWEILYEFDHLVDPLHVNGNNATHTGLHAMLEAGSPLLVWVYYSSVDNITRRVKSLDGVTFSEATVANLAIVSGSGMNREYVFQNVLYFMIYTGGGQSYIHVSYDPVTDLLVGLADAAFPFGKPDMNAVRMDWMNVNNRFVRIALNPNTGQNYGTIFELQFGQWIAKLEYGIANEWHTLGDWGPCMFVDPSDPNLIITIYLNGNTGLWAARKLVYTPLTNTWADGGDCSVILPPALLNGNTTARFMVQVDTDTTPGTPVVYVHVAFHQAPTVPWQALQYVNATTQMLDLGATTGDVAITLPQIRSGGGERFFTEGQPGLTFLGEVNPPPTSGLRFRLLGVIGSDAIPTKTVSVRFSKIGEIVTALCTLSDLSPALLLAGATLGPGNQSILNWPMDGIEYQFTWLALGDGVPDTTRAKYGFGAV